MKRGAVADLLLDREHLAALAAEAATGTTMTDLGKRLGVSRDTLARAFQQAGITVERASTLERSWETVWRQFGSDAYPFDTQYKFSDTRGWRFDVAWPARLVAVELHGGGWNRGRHHRPAGMANDAAKINAAIELGWAVLVYTSDMLDADPQACVAQVLRVLGQRP